MRLPSLDIQTLQSKNKIRPEIVEKINAAQKKLGKLEFIPNGTTPYEFLIQLAWEGMVRLGWDTSEKHIQALERELTDVKIANDNNNMDFATYFLVVWDIIGFARNQNILTGCGRGSGYASLILRCLRITYGPDPLEHGLLWERFLGFDWRYILLDDDWGFGDSEEAVAVIQSDEDDEVDDLDEERDVEDDMGGTDRY